VLPLMAKATQGRYLGIVKNYLKPAFGEDSLRDLTPLTLQRYFTGLVNSTLSYESKDKIRDVLSSVLGSAREYGLLVTNPAEGIRLPRDKHGRKSKPYVDPTKFSTLLTLISEPYSTMTHLAVFTGLRVSGRYDHGFVAAACLAANEAHWIRFLSSWNQAISLAMAIDHRHDASHSVERWILKFFFLLQRGQPSLDFQRFDTQRDAVSEDAFVAFYGCMSLWLDGFRTFDQSCSA
jgi:hypothetical protein